MAQHQGCEEVEEIARLTGRKASGERPVELFDEDVGTREQARPPVVGGARVQCGQEVDVADESEVRADGQPLCILVRQHR